MTVNAGEEALWRGIQRGERQAFSAVVRAHEASVRRFAAAFLEDAVEGDDVAQQAFLGLWRERRTVEPRGSLRGHLLARARHLCLTRARDRGRAERRLRMVAAESQTPSTIPLDQLVERDEAQETERLAARLATLVNGLDDDPRTAIWMRFSGGASFEEIAEVLGRPAHAVRALVYRQLATLRRRLGEDVA